MPILRLRFPGGRYHATPWGHHVNEGQLEWPPSPWRLLRAFIACGFNTQGWSEIPAEAVGLIQKLAAVLPSYRLPQAAAAHSRHYMPTGVLEKGREKTTLVFDTWGNLGDGVIDIEWDCMLDPEELEILRKLACSLGYLGRSESWVEAQLLEVESSACKEFDAFPHRDGMQLGPQWEQTSLLAPINPETFEIWRRRMADQVAQNFPVTEDRISAGMRKRREKALAPYPQDILDCMLKDTVWWKEHGWAQPPGSQRVIYWRRSETLEVGVPERACRRRVQRVPMMLLALTTPSGNRSALPPCSRTLPQAELLHRAMVARVGKGRPVTCPELTGRDEYGVPLKDGHSHAHILPVDLDRDGHLDHIMIHAPMGLGEMAQLAIRRLRRTWTKGGVGEMQIAVAGIGGLDALRSLPNPFSLRIESILAPREGAKTWISMTPFVPPRFAKRSGVNTLLGQINAELKSRKLPTVEDLEVLPWIEERLALRHFIRSRSRGGVPPPVDIGYALRLRFSQPILGPLVLGYASHFGLGMFEAVVN